MIMLLSVLALWDNTVIVSIGKQLQDLRNYILMFIAVFTTSDIPVILNG